MRGSVFRMNCGGILNRDPREQSKRATREPRSEAAGPPVALVIPFVVRSVAPTPSTQIQPVQSDLELLPQSWRERALGIMKLVRVVVEVEELGLVERYRLREVPVVRPDELRKREVGAPGRRSGVESSQETKGVIRGVFEVLVTNHVAPRKIFDD